VSFGRFAEEPRFVAALAAERARLGDGPYLVLSQVRELDLDGYQDGIELIASFADERAARAAMSDALRAMPARGDHTWVAESTFSLPIELDLDVAGVVLVAALGGKRTAPGGFEAETRVVQLLRIVTPPVVGEPLFRACRYSHDLVDYFLRR
jgi:hypothetical protein